MSKNQFSIVASSIYVLFNLIFLTLFAWIILTVYLLFLSHKAALRSIIAQSTQFIIMRIDLFLHSAPLLCTVWFVCIVDGLVKRDIRKFQGARESSFLFHRYKLAASFSFYSLYFINMVSFAVPSHYMLLVQACLTGFFLKLSIQQFKKYV